MSNYAFDRKPYMPTTSSCLVGPRAESISMSCEQWFEVVGYMARPGRVSSFEAEIPKDGRDKVFENLFPGQVYRPIELGDTPSGLPNKLGAQFRINFASLDNCPGMILGNGEIQRGTRETTITIDIPYKNLYTDDLKDVSVYVKASTVDIRSIIEPLIGHDLTVTQSKHSTKMSFTKSNDEYVMRELMRLIGNGTHHSTMRMNPELFGITADEKKALLKGIADVTGYIRKSNIAFGQEGAHRVYIEIPGNWYMVIDIANMLKAIDVPVQTIDFGHPNFRDGKLVKYNEGKPNFWKKEHQVKIFANEFLAVGFNIQHKQEALEKYSEELLEFIDPAKTHKFYWEKPIRRSVKPHHPGENDPYLPEEIRGQHFDSWTDLAKVLGYGE